MIYTFSALKTVYHTHLEMKFGYMRILVESVYFIYLRGLHWGVNYGQVADNADPGLDTGAETARKPC